MKINLRKAAALDKAIVAYLAGQVFPTRVDITKFEKPADVLAKAREGFGLAVVVRTALLKSRYEIRSKVAKANVESGITDLLAQAALDTDFIATLTTLVASTATPEEAVLNGRHAALNAPPTERGYGNTDHITVGAVSAKGLDDMKSEIAETVRHKQKLQDTLLEANIRTNIEISDMCASALKAAKLL